MDNVNELLFEFKEHLHVLNRSPATIKTYTEQAGIFLQAVDVGDIKAVTKSHKPCMRT